MKLLSSTEILVTPIFRITEDHAAGAGGFEIKRAIIQHPGASVMMAVDEKQRILLVRQYRLPLRKFTWELPAGKLDSGETPLAAAKRELQEETGYRAKSWKKLIAFVPSPGVMSEKMTVFLARNLSEGTAHNMEDERIACRWCPAREVEQMIRKGKIQDAKTLIGYYAWRHLHGRP